MLRHLPLAACDQFFAMVQKKVVHIGERQISGLPRSSASVPASISGRCSVAVQKTLSVRHRTKHG